MKLFCCFFSLKEKGMWIRFLNNGLCIGKGIHISWAKDRVITYSERNKIEKSFNIGRLVIRILKKINSSK